MTFDFLAIGVCVDFSSAAEAIAFVTAFDRKVDAYCEEWLVPRCRNQRM